jgi:N-acetyl-anhydromuramyl-L-alanine amidase AmpD
MVISLFCRLPRVLPLVFSVKRQSKRTPVRAWHHAFLLLPILFLLNGCSWLPFSKPKPSQEDLINRLLYETPEPTPRPLGQPGLVPRSDKQITMAPVISSRRVPPQLTLDTVRRCLLSRGILDETFQVADPSNYDIRAPHDALGRPIDGYPRIIVLHETVVSEEATLNLFRTPHQDETYQASYHMLIARDGRRVRIVSDENRAFGAGNSAFRNYTIRLKPESPGSINNIALHLSLVSPPDGRGEAPTHSGYTDSQYQSAAAQVLLWQVSYGIPLQYLTTHKAVDKSQTRKDPRSFHWKIFLTAHRQLASACGLLGYAAGGH